MKLTQLNHLKYKKSLVKKSVKKIDKKKINADKNILESMKIF